MKDLILSPRVRMDIVRARMIGMRQGSAAALEKLDSVVGDDLESEIGVQLLKVELLYLDRQHSDAEKVFDTEVRPRLGELSARVAVLITDNRMLVARAQLPSQVSEFYFLADQRRLMNVEVWDHKSAASIHDAVREDKHIEALRLCWQQLLHAYDSCCWRRTILAELDMARECLALGLIPEAAHHCMMACDVDFVDRIGQRLLNEATDTAVRETLNKVLSTSALVRHATVVAELLHRITDIIPDALVVNVFDWLIKRGSYESESIVGPSLLVPTWQAMAGIAHRMTESQAAKIIDMAIHHSQFTKSNAQRRYIVDAVNRCLSQVDESELRRIAASVLPLALDQKDDIDFANVIELLCHLADRGGDENRRILREALYPSNRAVNNAILIQVARYFGANVKSKESLNKAALELGSRIRLQVQQIKAGEQPAKLGGFGTLSAEVGEGKERIIVHIQGAIHNVEALIAHREKLSKEAVQALLSGVLEMIANSDNVIANRVSLVKSVRRLMDSVPEEMADKIIGVLQPLAAGEIVESRASMSYAEATNPLNPYKVSTGNPADLRGVSLMTLSEIEKRFPGILGESFDVHLLSAIADPSPHVRAFGCAAARLSGSLSQDILIAVLLATGDANHETAATALSVFLGSSDLKFDPHTWTLLVTCLERAQQAPNVELRKEAVKVVHRALALGNVTNSIATRLHRLRNLFAQDVSFAVRSKTRHPIK